MPGLYCNEQQVYLPVDSLLYGHWYFARESEQLIIIANDDYGISDDVGADEELLEKIQNIYRVDSFLNIDQDKVAEQLDLEVVQDYQKALDPNTGYYFN
jgi:hypothetical protein